MKEFSKRVVKWLCVAWFIGGGVGLAICAYAVIVEITTVDTVLNFLIAYIGAPLLCTIIGYLCKAAFENVKKIRNSMEGNTNENQLEE